MKKAIVYFNSDRYIKEVLLGNEYSIINDYPVVVDIGANIGTFSLSIYSHAEKIYAIEPSSKLVKMFKKTIEENKLEKIEVFKMAIADTNGEIDIRMGGTADGGGWTIMDHSYAPPKERGKTKCMMLKDFLDENLIDYVDLLKMDAEGAERIILNQDFPKERVGNIVVENHYADWDIKEVLEGLGYKVINEGIRFLGRKK